MHIKISDHAIDWFKDELSLRNGDTVRFFVRYGGSSPIQEGFSLGLNKEEPMDPGVILNKDGVTFFIEERDIWYFKDYNLIVDFDEDTDGPVYSYKK